jgi:PAS domain S-box-containing protein
MSTSMESEDPRLERVEPTGRIFTERPEPDTSVIPLDALAPPGAAGFLIDGTAFVECNEAAASTLGYSCQRDVPMVHPSHLSPPFQPDGRNSFDKANEMMAIARAEGFHRFKWAHRRSNGEEFAVEVSLTQVADQGKSQLLCVWSDIVAPHCIADPGKCRGERFQNAFQYAPIGMAFVSLEGVWLEANAMACSIVGYTETELSAMTVQEITHPDDQASDISRRHEMISGRMETCSAEQRYIHKKGHVVWVLKAVTLICDRSGTPLYFISQMEDITDRKRSEDRLRQLSQAVEQSPASIVIAGPSGEIEYVNRKCMEVTGYTSDELVGQNPRILQSGEGRPEDYRELWETITSGREWRGEFHNKKKNDDLFWERASISPIRDDSGRITHYLAVKEDVTERKQAEDELIASRLKLAQAMDLANLANWEYDVATDKFFFDSRFYAIYGTTDEREGGSHMSSAAYAREFVHPDDLDMVGVEIGKALSSTESRYVRNLEHRIIRRDGQVRHIVVRVEVIRNAAGQIISYRGANQDITVLKDAEEALRASQQILEGIMNAIPVRVFWKNTDLAYMGCNAAFAHDAGLADQNDIIGKSDYQLGWRDQADAYRNDDRQVMESGQSRLLIEESQTTPEGKTITLLTNKLPLRGQDDEICGVLGTYMDITEHKRTEEELQKRNDFIEKLLENSPIGFAVHTIDDGRAVFVSQNFENIYGVQPNSIHSIDDYFEQAFSDPDHRRTMRERMSADVASGEIERMRWENVPITTASGEFRFITAIYIPLFDQNLMISTVQDVTDQQNMQAQLAQAQKLESIGQLAAGIAHEINTPTQFVADNTRFLKDGMASLSRVIGRYSEALAGLAGSDAGLTASEQMRSVLEDEDMDYLAEQIPLAIDQSLDGLSRIAAIVGAMKDFSHPDSDTATLADLNAAIQSTVGVSRNEWKYVANLELHLDDSLPMVQCYIGKLNQAILNLIINAVHAIADANQGTERIGTITISTLRTENGTVEITVADDGTGIPEAARARVFDPFFTTKDVGKGTGQGLAIVHSVITMLHQGKVSFTTQLGVGTAFLIVLPTTSAKLSDIREVA